MNTDIVFDADLVRKYDKPGPRYTSYPSAPQFHDRFNERSYLERVGLSNQQIPFKPLSLYIHIPFCESLCFYCGCNKIITHNKGRAVDYLDVLFQEIAMQADLFDDERKVNQLHFGGGTPTYLNNQQLTSLMDQLNSRFDWSNDAERSIEVDPRTVSPEGIGRLADMGFNRMSLGVQDFNAAVQIAVNRIQGAKQTEKLVAAGRDSGFDSISYDLIYGLPKQTPDSFAATLDTVISHRPDRLAVYSYAHLPHLIKSQRLIRRDDLPSPEDKLKILEMTINKLTQAGYVYIGMDHFALADDSLTQALRQGSLQRNFQGYSTHADTDLIGLGMSAIGHIAGSYSQNYRDINDYYKAIGEGKLAVFRGLVPNSDDTLRRDIIQTLMCQGRVEFRPLEKRYGISFRDKFAQEIEQLRQMADDDLLTLNVNAITIRPLGRLLLRNICMVFDRYLKPEEARFSQTV